VPCTPDCRRRQLSLAFGITSSVSTVAPSYSGPLVAFAKAYPATLRIMERFLVAFVAASSRVGLDRSQGPPLPASSTRARFHDLARYYGVRTWSTGDTGERIIWLGRREDGGEPQLPTIPLSAVVHPEVPDSTSNPGLFVSLRGATDSAPVEGAGNVATTGSSSSTSGDGAAADSSNVSLASASASIQLQYAAAALGLSVVWLRRAAGLIATATKADAIAAAPQLERAAPAFDVAVFDDTDPAVYGYTRSGPSGGARTQGYEQDQRGLEAVPTAVAARAVVRSVSAFEEEGDDPVFGAASGDGVASTASPVPDAWDS